MTDLKTITKSLRSAVDAGDLGGIANGVASLERLEAWKGLRKVLKGSYRKWLTPREQKVALKELDLLMRQV